MLKKTVTLLCVAAIILSIAAPAAVFAAGSGIDASCLSVSVINSMPAKLYTPSELPGFRIRVTNPDSISRSVRLNFTVEDESGNTVWVGNNTSRILTANSVNLFTECPNVSKNGNYVFKVTMLGDFSTVTKSESFSVIRECRSSDPSLSVQFHLDLPDYGENAAANIALAKNAGFGRVRDDLRWAAVERTRGEYSIPAAREKQIDDIIASGRKPVLTLGFNNLLYAGSTSSFPTGTAAEKYAEFCGYVAGYFKGRAEEFEIWNEPDNAETAAGQKTTGAEYAALLRMAYTAIKAANPDARVIAGATCNFGSRNTQRFISELFEQSDLGNYMDAISFHPYDYWDMCMPDENTGSHAALNFLETVILPGLSGWGKPDMPIWFTEYGVPSKADDYFGKELSKYYNADVQAQQLVRATVQFRADSRIEAVSVYNLREISAASAKGYVFGIAGGDYSLKPAYIAMANLSERLAGSKPVHSFADTVYSGRSMSCYEFLRETAAADDSIFVLWGHTGKTASVSLLQGGGVQTPTYTESGAAARISIPEGYTFSCYDMQGNELEFESGETVTLGTEPIYISAEKKKTISVLSENGTVAVCGAVDEPDRQLTLTVFDRTTGGAFAAAAQTKSAADGSFEFRLQLDEGHIYSFYIFDGNVKTAADSVTDGAGVISGLYINGTAAESLDGLKSGDRLTVRLKLSNCNAENGTLKFYGALYGNGGLYTAAAAPVTNESEGGASSELTLDVGDESMVQLLKLFVWDANLKPVTDIVDIQRKK